MAVGAGELGQHEAVKAVALAAGDGIAGPHRLDLVGMHRDDSQARIQQPLDQQPIGPLERHQRHPQAQQPHAQRPDPRLVVPVAAPLQDPPALVDHAHRVLLARPVHPGKPTIRHDYHSLEIAPVAVELR